MSATELREREIAPAKQTAIRHIATTCCPPYTRTLCGLPIGDDNPCPTQSQDSEDCVVCLDMETATPCRRCGSRYVT